jgi:PIN domain nuclease of toxin-antitoxin system
MKILIDTHVFLWGLQAEEKLSEHVRQLLPVSEVWMSVGSLWEIIVKAQARRLRLPRPVGEYLTEKLSDNGVFVLPLTFGHVMRLESLPVYHRDPFDRILIAQSLEEDLPLVTADKVFARYPVKVIWN